MVMNISSNSGVSEKTRRISAGLTGGVIGMSAYYLPVTKDRFVRTAYDIMKDDAEEQIVKFNETALNVQSGRLKAEQKLFLSQEGVGETVADINAKVADLKKLLVDKDHIKSIKEDLANNFESFKSSEAFRDTFASKAFKKIRWTNFAWGAGIGFILAATLSAGKSKNYNN